MMGMFDWQKRNAEKCSCRGADEYCPCQNDKHYFDGATYRHQSEQAAIAPYVDRIAKLEEVLKRAKFYVSEHSPAQKNLRKAIDNLLAEEK